MALQSFEGKTPILGKGVYVDHLAVLVGDIEVGDDSSLWPFVAARGDVNSIRIGARTNIQDGSVLHVTHDGIYTPGGYPLTIGDDVTVGHKALLHACTIGNRCLIGMGAIVMDGAVLEDEVFVAAGALVSPGKTLKSGWLYRGNPARPTRELSGQEREMLLYSAAHYVRLKDRYLTNAD